MDDKRRQRWWRTERWAANGAADLTERVSDLLQQQNETWKERERGKGEGENADSVRRLLKADELLLLLLMLLCLLLLMQGNTAAQSAWPDRPLLLLLFRCHRLLAGPAQPARSGQLAVGGHLHCQTSLVSGIAATPFSPSVPLLTECR